jgi:hypothetical protein
MCVSEVSVHVGYAAYFSFVNPNAYHLQKGMVGKKRKMFLGANGSLLRALMTENS